METEARKAHRGLPPSASFQLARVYVSRRFPGPNWAQGSAFGRRLPLSVGRWWTALFGQRLSPWLANSLDGTRRVRRIPHLIDWFCPRHMQFPTFELRSRTIASDDSRHYLCPCLARVCASVCAGLKLQSGASRSFPAQTTAIPEVDHGIGSD